VANMLSPGVLSDGSEAEAGLTLALNQLLSSFSQLFPFIFLIAGAIVLMMVMKRMLLGKGHVDEDDMPLSSFSPQGVADAARASQVLKKGGTIEQASRVSGDSGWGM